MRFKNQRERDERHLGFLRSLCCVICGDNTTIEAAHLRSGNLDYGKRSTGMQEKPSDKWCLPVCGRHHREQHTTREINFWTNYGKDPFALCARLWMVSGDHEMGETIIERQL